MRVPPKAIKWAPGFRTRSTRRHVSGSNAIPVPSHALPMNPVVILDRPAGESTLSEAKPLPPFFFAVRS